MLAAGAGDRTSQGPLSREDCRAVAASICPSRTWQHWPELPETTLFFFSFSLSLSLFLSRLQPMSLSSSIYLCQSVGTQTWGGMRRVMLKEFSGCSNKTRHKKYEAGDRGCINIVSTLYQLGAMLSTYINMMKWRKWRTVTLSLLGQSSPWVWELVRWIEGCLSCISLVEVSWGNLRISSARFPKFPYFSLLLRVRCEAALFHVDFSDRDYCLFQLPSNLRSSAHVKTGWREEKGAARQGQGTACLRQLVDVHLHGPTLRKVTGQSQGLTNPWEWVWTSQTSPPLDCAKRVWPKVV